jgi:hypothetical protein
MQELSADWWAKILTINPKCTYYFGPFETNKEAHIAYPGYVEDLDIEGAKGIVIVVERCQPNILTICEEE